MVCFERGGGDISVRPGQAPHAAASSRSLVVLVEGIRAGEGSFGGQYAGYLMLEFFFTFWLSDSRLICLVFSVGFELFTGVTVVVTRSGSCGITVVV